MLRLVATGLEKFQGLSGDSGDYLFDYLNHFMFKCLLRHKYAHISLLMTRSNLPKYQNYNLVEYKGTFPPTIHAVTYWPKAFPFYIVHYYMLTILWLCAGVAKSESPKEALEHLLRAAAQYMLCEGGDRYTAFHEMLKGLPSEIHRRSTFHRFVYTSFKKTFRIDYRVNGFDFFVSRIPMNTSTVPENVNKVSEVFKEKLASSCMGNVEVI
jgi:hypothetical protein